MRATKSYPEYLEELRKKVKILLRQSNEIILSDEMDITPLSLRKFLEGGTPWNRTLWKIEDYIYARRV